MSILTGKAVFTLLQSPVMVCEGQCMVEAWLLSLLGPLPPSWLLPLVEVEVEVEVEMERWAALPGPAVVVAGSSPDQDLV